MHFKKRLRILVILFGFIALSTEAQVDPPYVGDMIWAVAQVPPDEEVFNIAANEMHFSLRRGEPCNPNDDLWVVNWIMYGICAEIGKPPDLYDIDGEIVEVSTIDGDFLMSMYQSLIDCVTGVEVACVCITGVEPACLFLELRNSRD